MNKINFLTAHVKSNNLTTPMLVVGEIIHDSLSPGLILLHVFDVIEACQIGFSKKPYFERVQKHASTAYSSTLLMAHDHQK